MNLMDLEASDLREIILNICLDNNNRTAIKIVHDLTSQLRGRKTEPAQTLPTMKVEPKDKRESHKRKALTEVEGIEDEPKKRKIAPRDVRIKLRRNGKFLDDFLVFRTTMPSQGKIKALLGKAFKSAGASTAKEEEKKKKKEKESASQEAREATSAVASAATTITTTTATTTTTTTPPVAPAASASACVSLPASAPASRPTASSAPVDSASTSAAVVSATSVPAPAPAHRPPPGQHPFSGSVRCGRCGCGYFPAANNALACYHHPGAVFFRHASQRGYIPSLDMVDRPYEPQAFVWTCCRGVVGQSSGCVYRRHVPAGAQAPAGRGGVSPRMNFRGENPGAFGM
ncbi:hypothetical protein DL767_002782 [Monosporascus sp. MG133]|nr:hypothetical protein DL767_002782 [Monosporascus sp. MG133]